MTSEPEKDLFSDWGRPQAKPPPALPPSKTSHEEKHEPRESCTSKCDDSTYESAYEKALDNYLNLMIESKMTRNSHDGQYYCDDCHTAIEDCECDDDAVHKNRINMLKYL